jgi:predicted permease
MMGMGMILVKCKILHSDDSIVLSKLCVYVIMPATILNSFQVDVTSEVKQGMIFAFGVALLFQGVLVLAGLLLQKGLKMDTVETDSIIYSNAGNLVSPLVSAVLGQEWVIYASAYVSVQLFFMWSHGVSGFLDMNRFDLRKVLLNINMISVFIGLFMLLTGIRMPQILTNTCSSVSAMLGPSAMLITGMIVGGMSIRKVFSSMRVYRVCLFRLVLMPLLILFLIWALHLKTWITNGEQILLVSFLAVITPAASTITQFAQLYGKDSEYAGTINIMTTMLCIITMPLMVMVYQLL